MSSELTVVPTPADIIREANADATNNRAATRASEEQTEGHCRRPNINPHGD